MYNLILVFSMLAVVLSPLLLDLYLTLREKKTERRPIRSQKKRGPSLAWASPRLR